MIWFSNKIKSFLFNLKECIDKDNSLSIAFAHYQEIWEMIGEDSETEIKYITDIPFRENFHHISDGTVFSSPFSK